MVNLLLDDGMQNGKDSKTYPFMNTLFLGHPHEPTESQYGLRFAYLGSVQNFFFKFTIPVFYFIYID